MQTGDIFFHRNTWSYAHGFVNGDQIICVHNSMHKAIQVRKENALTTCENTVQTKLKKKMYDINYKFAHFLEFAQGVNFKCVLYQRENNKFNPNLRTNFRRI